MSRIRLFSLFFVAMILVAMSCPAQQSADRPIAQRKKLVAVFDFDNRAVKDNIYSIYGANEEVGKGVAGLLVEKLLKDGQYRIVERRAIDDLLAAQNIPATDRTDPAAIARMGRLLGLDAVIQGSVTKFSREEVRVKDGMRLRNRALSVARLKKGELKAECAITARLIDTMSGEVLATARAEGVSTREGTSLFSGGILSSGSLSGGIVGPTKFNNDGIVGFDTHAPNFEQSLLGEAVTKAINALSMELDFKAGTFASHKPELAGTVADVTDNILVVNIGNRSGLQIGDKLEITRTLRLIVDPKTGKILKPVTENIGEGTVVEMNAEFATLSFSGEGTARIGDVARTPFEQRFGKPAGHSQENAAVSSAGAAASSSVPVASAAGDSSTNEPATANGSRVLYAPH
jgi:curli biogenesis system outer membrane secretion channel CsgG